MFNPQSSLCHGQERKKPPREAFPKARLSRDGGDWTWSKGNGEKCAASNSVIPGKDRTMGTQPLSISAQTKLLYHHPSSQPGPSFFRAPPLTANSQRTPAQAVLRHLFPVTHCGGPTFLPLENLSHVLPEPLTLQLKSNPDCIAETEVEKKPSPFPFSEPSRHFLASKINSFPTFVSRASLRTGKFQRNFVRSLHLKGTSCNYPTD